MAVLEPVVLELVALEPAALEPVALEPVVLDVSGPAVLSNADEQADMVSKVKRPVAICFFMMFVTPFLMVQGARRKSCSGTHQLRSG